MEIWNTPLVDWLSRFTVGEAILTYVLASLFGGFFTGIGKGIWQSIKDARHA